MWLLLIVSSFAVMLLALPPVLFRPATDQDYRADVYAHDLLRQHVRAFGDKLHRNEDAYAAFDVIERRGLHSWTGAPCMLGFQSREQAWDCFHLEANYNGEFHAQAPTFIATLEAERATLDAQRLADETAILLEEGEPSPDPDLLAFLRARVAETSTAIAALDADISALGPLETMGELIGYEAPNMVTAVVDVGSVAQAISWVDGQHLVYTFAAIDDHRISASAVLEAARRTLGKTGRPVGTAPDIGTNPNGNPELAMIGMVEMNGSGELVLNLPQGPRLLPAGLQDGVVPDAEEGMIMIIGCHAPYRRAIISDPDWADYGNRYQCAP